MKEVLELVSTLVAGGASNEYAWAAAERAYPEDAVEAARRYVSERKHAILTLPEPTVVQRAGTIDPWYLGPLPGHRIWPATRSALLADGIPETAMDEDIDPASTRVVNHMPPPGDQEIESRGLVVGFVQSGKTTSFTSVIAKAADGGYRLVIVMSGIHDALRQQTQERLTRYLVEAGGTWLNLTHDGDFANPPPLEQVLAPTGARALAVVKKNPHRLRRLARWLDQATELRLKNTPILVIDDEADQASIDVGSKRRSTINHLILEILNRPKASYVAYTATPFANMLIDPEANDLYPDDFIAALPRPRDYFGPETLFGRQPLSEDDDDEDLDGLGIVGHVDDDDAAAVRPPRKRADRAAWSPTVPDSMREAILWFVLSTATRRCREGPAHSSMLIHTTMYTDAHGATADVVNDLIRQLRVSWEQRDEALLDEVRGVWEALNRPDLAARFDLQAMGYEVLQEEIPGVLEDLEVVVDNYRSETRLAYPPDRPVTVIVIGGNTLSRGLTLEGLVVSYFVRAASAYDTLMQMGRWFGFRRGYEDLPRVWMTPDLEDYFIRLATVEAEVRADVERYRLEGKTPRDFAVRIRTTPGLAVTSRAKMRSGVTVRVSYADQRVQTFMFDHEDSMALESNIEAARELITSSAEAGIHFRERERRQGWWLAQEVPWELVRAFLATYSFHEDHADLNAETITRFVEKQIALGGITTWNVVVAGVANDAHGTIDLGLPKEANLMVRSRMAGITDKANIKSLMTTIDRVADLPDKDEEAKAVLNGPAGGRGGREGRLKALRPDGVAMLALYPIQAESRPLKPARGKEQVRTALDAARDVIGVGLVFPRCSETDRDGVEYVMAFKEPLDLEDVDELLEEEARAADDLDAERLEQEDTKAGA